MKKLISISFLLTFYFSVFSQQIWTLDKPHARLGFSVVHQTISEVEGNFKNFDVSFVSLKDDFTDAKVELTIDVSSINTENEMRDTHLKSSSFFDIEKFKTITFKSTSFISINSKNYKLYGNITIHGVTKPIVFDVVYNGTFNNPARNTISAGFTVKGKLNRSDFKVGGEPSFIGIADEIQLKSNIEFTKNLK
jgi:polyisoprenoid-binding protein YceI